MVNEQFKYIKGLWERDKVYGEDLRLSYMRLSDLGEENLDHPLKMIYSNKLDARCAILVIDLITLQIINGLNTNAGKLFQNLTNNERKDYNKLLGNYKKITSSFVKKDFDVQKRESISNEIKTIQHSSTNSAIGLSDKNGVVYLKPRHQGEFVINPVIMPKAGWLLHIYADSFNDYCTVVQKTVGILKNAGITIYLNKPEFFQRLIATYKEGAIAYSILVNDVFSFSKIDDNLLSEWDNKVIPLQRNIRIADRVGAEYVSFCGRYMSDFHGNIVTNSQFLEEKYKSDVDLLRMLEQLGRSKNTVRYYTEIMTGILEKDSEQFYKAIIVKTKDIEKMKRIIAKYDKENLDFFADSNKEESKILFVHMSHLIDVINDLYDTDMEFQENPSFDNITMDDFEDENEE